MFSRFTALIPATANAWDVWSCPSGTSCQLLETTSGPGFPDKLPGRVIGALPALMCRTIALRIPSQDSKTSRQLAFVQLEKRGLAAATPAQTAFECYSIPQPGGGALLSVDVVALEATAAFDGMKPISFICAARCYLLPDGPLILMEEQGRLVLLAACQGTLLHSHIISADRAQCAQVAAEIRLASLSLLQQELLPAITGLEFWGDFPATETAALGLALSLPVRIKPRPVPDPARIAALSSTRLLSAPARAVERVRRLRSRKWLAAAAVLVLLLLWAGQQHRALIALEMQATRLEEMIQAASGKNLEEKAVHAKLRAAQERWQGLRMALEPKRYPLIQLNSFTRCLGAGSVVLGSFESKGPELSLSGTAQSALEAYTYYSTVGADPELRIYELSMVQPAIAADGTAAFQIKGKMR